MTPETKSQVASLAKTTGIIAAGALAVGVVTQLVLPSRPPGVLVSWGCRTNELPDVVFEVVSKTNLNGVWQFKTNVAGTNAIWFERKYPHEFFTISKVMNKDYTNAVLKQKGF